MLVYIQDAGLFVKTSLHLCKDNAVGSNFQFFQLPLTWNSRWWTAKCTASSSECSTAPTVASYICHLKTSEVNGGITLYLYKYSAGVRHYRIWYYSATVFTNRIGQWTVKYL